MKFFFLVSSFLLISCSAPQVNSFNRENVCSPKSLSYLSESKKVLKGTQTGGEAKASLVGMIKPMQNCYAKEVAKTGLESEFNLCLVVGLDQFGDKEFFEFSTQELELSDDTKSCLNEIGFSAKFGDLKEVAIIQPFKMRPGK